MVERKSSAFKSRFSRASKWLGREFGAALATAGSQDGATGTGLHALAKTVGLCAATGIWLESTLAHNHSPIEKSWESRWCRRRLVAAADSKRDNLSNLGQKSTLGQVISCFFESIF
jgi:hypothetical protein